MSHLEVNDRRLLNEGGALLAVKPRRELRSPVCPSVVVSWRRSRERVGALFSTLHFVSYSIGLIRPAEAASPDDLLNTGDGDTSHCGQVIFFMSPPEAPIDSRRA